MLKGLRESPPTANRLSRHETRLLGLVEIDLQHREQRNRHEGCNDGESSERPPPATDVKLKSLSGTGTSEGSDHVWRRCESEGDTTVPQTCGVDCDDHVGVDGTGGSDGGEDLHGKLVKTFDMTR